MDLVSIVVSTGVPVLVALFYLEGLAVGKLLQPPVVFVGYLTAVDPSLGVTIAIAVLCVVSTTGGQWTLYQAFNNDASETTGIRRQIPYLTSLPTVVRRLVSDRILTLVERWFNAYGVVVICVANVLPAVRNVVPIVAGVVSYRSRRFLVATTLGNCLYVCVLYVAALGVSQALSI